MWAAGDRSGAPAKAAQSGFPTKKEDPGRSPSRHPHRALEFLGHGGEVEADENVGGADQLTVALAPTRSPVLQKAHDYRGPRVTRTVAGFVRFAT